MDIQYIIKKLKRNIAALEKTTKIDWLSLK